MSATDDFAAAAQALTEGMRATTSDPLDAIRMLTAFANSPLPAVSSAGQAAQTIIAAVFRRSAMASIALACADYQPSSSTEASVMIQQIADMLDAEAVAAADAGQDASYQALRDIRAAVVADLSARSASLPELITVEVPGNLPSLVLAYRLYGDATREPGMVARTSVAHPGFMPSAFEALAA